MSAKIKKTKKHNKALGIIYSSNKDHIAISRYFTELNGREIYTNFDTIKNHRFFSQIVGFYGDHNVNLKRFGSIPSTDIVKSLYWGLSVFEYQRSSIQLFVTLESNLTEALLESNYDRCIEILDSIDNTLGLSTWSISTRCSVCTLAGKTEYKRDFLKSIRDRCGDNSFFFAISSNVSTKYQDNEILASDLSSFEAQIKRHIKGELLDFMLYKLCLRKYDSEYNYSNILNLEKNISLVDFYVACVDCLVGLSFNTKEYDDIEYILRKLTLFLDTPPLTSLANYYGIKTEWTFKKTDSDLLDLYTKGAYSKVIQIFCSLPLYEFQIFELVAKSAARTTAIDTSAIKRRIIDSLVMIITKGENYERCLAFLVNLSHGFSTLRYFKELHLFVESETKLLGLQKKKYIKKMSIVLSGFTSPRKSEIFNTDLMDQYLQMYQREVGTSATWDFFKVKDAPLLLLNFEHDVEKNRLTKYIAKSLIDNNKQKEALPMLKELVKCTDILIQQEASKLLVDCYLEIGDVEGALQEFAITCINNPYLLINYDTDIISKNAIEKAKESNSIYIPIVLSLHSNYVDDKYDSALRYTFENFLEKNCIESPLDGLAAYELYPPSMVDYFLESVCVPETMKLYLGFETSKDIDRCRISICNYLIEKDTANKQSLIYEIKELTKKLVISDAIKCVENSKIYSDLTVFHSEGGKKKLEHLFYKFQELRQQDFTNFDDEKEFKNIYNTLKQQGLIDKSRSILSLASLNEKNATFLNLLQRMRDEFTFGDKGLNTYLSTRIRHGYLPTMIRKEVSNENLLCQKDPYKNTFSSNDFWLNKIYTDEKIQKKLDLIFIEFSKNFENKISEINDQWLQIYFLDQSLSTLGDKVSKTESLFNYSIFNLESYILQQKIPTTTTYSEFIKHVVDWLWERTDVNLTNVRDKISMDAKKTFIGYLDNLQHEIYVLLENRANISELNDSIARARTNLPNNIDQLVTWFTRSNENTLPQYDIDIAVEIAQKTACVNVEFEKDQEYKLLGWTLSHFVDFLYIILENAISKSRLPKQDIKLKITLSSVDDVVSLEIRNNCKLDELLSDANLRVEYYRINYGKETIGRQGIQSEGGTGFFKIWNILHRVLNLTHLIDLMYCDDNTFLVKFNFYDFNKVIYHENPDSRRLS